MHGLRVVPRERFRIKKTSRAHALHGRRAEMIRVHRFTLVTMPDRPRNPADIQTDMRVPDMFHVKHSHEEQ
jgi:hypothetical protein